MYTNAQIDNFIVGVKKYADDNDANTQYGIEYDSVNKKIKLTNNTSKTEIDATAFIKDGMIESVALSADGKNFVITWNADSDKGENNVTTIPLSGLIDIYTGVDGTTVKVEVSNDNKVGAEVKAGAIKNNHLASDAAIAKGKLASDVQTSLGKADSAIQEADIASLKNNSHTHTFNEVVLNSITPVKVSAWDNAEQNAKDYADNQIKALPQVDWNQTDSTKSDYIKNKPGILSMSVSNGTLIVETL